LLGCRGLVGTGGFVFVVVNIVLVVEQKLTEVGVGVRLIVRVEFEAGKVTDIDTAELE
jgi:hypothetical protein